MAELKDVSIQGVRRRGGNSVRFDFILTIESDGADVEERLRVRSSMFDGESFGSFISRKIEELSDKFDSVVEQVAFTSQESNIPFVLTQYHRGEIEEWSAPSGSHDAPNMDDLRTHAGHIWRSTMDGNITEPSEDPLSEWDLVIEIPS
jgi:hypothetical protein